MSIFGRIANKVRRSATIYWRRRKARKVGIAFFPPNYIYFDDFDPSCLMIDVGCGHEAELSLHLIDRYGVRAVGVDPTKKHAPFLAEHQQATAGRFRHLPCAIASTDGVLTFHESEENESGSLMDSHTNVLHDHIHSYDVEAVSLRNLLPKIGEIRGHYLKLDLEGAEYDLLSGIERDDLTPFNQVFVEFHHHCIENRSARDTAEIVTSMHRLGLTSFTLDDHNYLFYWPDRENATAEND